MRRLAGGAQKGIPGHSRLTLTGSRPQS
jgi:hypothetical protein